MTFEELKEKALSLPYSPGVYLMQDKTNTVIYVGKAKKLHNRVSQYFQDSSAHTPKTRKMVSQIDHFDTIVAASEFEALVLECSLIKRYMPKYNILLKDGKGYPYLRIDRKKLYPRLEMVNKVENDGAEYFGPFGGRYLTQQVIDTLLQTLKLPSCSRRFPEDIGKDRVCLNYHMDHCDGWCQKEAGNPEYRKRMEQVAMVLHGDYQTVANDLKQQMLAASDAMEFERAASLRDRLRAIETLGQKQFVTAGHLADTDVIGYAKTEAKACFVVLHFVGGNLLDKEYEIVSLEEDQEEAVDALVKQFYLTRGAVPKRIFVPFPMEDSEPFAQMLFEQYGRKVVIHAPQRGDNRRLLELAHKNAEEEAIRLTTKAEKLNGTLRMLQTLLGLEKLPERMESYDISHIAGTDIVASMIVFEHGKPKKSDYRHFRLENMDDQDDYAAMRQVLHRRFAHYLAQDKGFAEKPDCLLIDGGIAHAHAVVEELAEMGVSIPTFGMVKDDRHRTRALVTPQGQELGINTVPALFALIGNIQEETHRFAITFHKNLRSKRLRASALDEIPGIGDVRKQKLLRHFQSLKAIREADVTALSSVLPKPTAEAVYAFFHKEDASCES